MQRLRLSPATGVPRLRLLLQRALVALTQRPRRTLQRPAPPRTEIIVDRRARGVAPIARSTYQRNAAGGGRRISAEDIGKFPDTNLAESLQRITGVSIDRVNGEGSQVTVRGFGPGFNLVTLNGRALPTASIASIGSDQNGDFGGGTTRRSTSRTSLRKASASLVSLQDRPRLGPPSGGIGATINIVTRKPLDGPVGFTRLDRRQGGARPVRHRTRPA